MTATERDLFSLWQRNPIFCAAGEAACRELVARYPAEPHPEGTVFARAGEEATQVFVVLSGTVRIYQTAADGSEVLIKLLRAPCIFSDLELLAGMAMLKDVAAVEEVLVAKIPAPAFLELLLACPAAMMAYLQQMAGAFCVAVRNQRQVTASIQQRLANLLLSFAAFCGTPQGQDIVVGRGFSHRELAQSLGVVRRSVTQVISAWTQKGILSKTDTQLVIHRADKLEELAAPIRGSLCFQMGMELGSLSRPDAPVVAQIELLDGPGSLPGRRYAVEGELLVGKRPPCQLQLPDDLVSVRHCRVFRGATGSRFWIEDLGSENGTWVNGKQINRAVLRDDDVIQVGSIRGRFSTRRRQDPP